MEGKEVRFGIFGSTLFAGATTLTSTDAVNSSAALSCERCVGRRRGRR